MGDLIKMSSASPLLKAFDAEKMESLLEQASEKLGRPNGWVQKKSFAPSGVGYGSGTCPRYWYIAFHGAEFKYNNTARQRANMDNGTAAGKRIAELFKQAGLIESTEVETHIVHDDPPISGYMDLDITWQGEEMVGEVKTTTTEAFQTRLAKNAAPGYQLIQLLSYMKVLKRDKGFFYVENKNTHEVLVIPVKMTPERQELIDGVFDWMRRVKKSSDENQLPQRPFTPRSQQCKSCPVWDTCWDGYVKKTAKIEGADPNPGVVMLPPLEVPK